MSVGDKQATNTGSLLGKLVVPDGLKPKDLIGIPWMLALALRDDGWWLRSTILWKKRNVLPSSAKDRPTTDFEYIFLLAKNGAKPSFWTHRDGYGSRTKPVPDYRWKDMLVGDEVDTEPLGDWRSDTFVGSPTSRKEGKRTDIDSADETVSRRRWRRFNLWSGHAYYYNGDAIKEPMSEATRARDKYGFKGAFKGQFKGSPDEKRWQDGRPIESPEFFSSTGRNKRTVWNEGETYQNVWNLIGAFQEAGASDELIEEATAIFGDMLGSESSILDIPTKSFKGAHFATWPPALAEVMILAGSAEKACPVCGAGFLPRKVKTGEFQRRWGKGNQDGSPYTSQSSMQAIYEDKGLQPTCSCPENDGSGASVVLDPFSGGGTTCMVAKQKHRHWTGIDASEKYVIMSEKRVDEAEPESDPDDSQMKLPL